jgi:hypothetical protein
MGKQNASKLGRKEVQLTTAQGAELERRRGLRIFDSCVRAKGEKGVWGEFRAFAKKRKGNQGK